MGGGPVVKGSSGRVISLLNDDAPPPVPNHTRPALSRSGRRSASPELRARRPEAPDHGPDTLVYGSPAPAYGRPAAAYSPRDDAYGFRVPVYRYHDSDHDQKTAGNGSIPPTPELSRSDSYDSRMAAEPPSPMTPFYEYSSRYQSPAKNSRYHPDEFIADAQSFYLSNKRKAGVLDDGHPVDYEDKRPAIPPSPSGSTLGAEKPAQKRFPCRFRDQFGCDKTFTTSGHASRHSKIHTAEKAVPCSHSGCPKKFTRSDNMKQHLDTHYKDKSRPTPNSRPGAPSEARRRRSNSSLASAARQKRASPRPAVLQHQDTWSSSATDTSSRRSSLSSPESLLGAQTAAALPSPSPASSTAATSVSPGEQRSPGALMYDMRELHGHLDRYHQQQKQQQPDIPPAAATALRCPSTTRLDTLVMVAERERQEMC